MFLPKQSEMRPVRRVNLPSKMILKQFLVETLQANVNHDQLGPQIARLLEYVEQKDADKMFYAVLLRHLNASHVVF